jgi:hypothetical protein
MQEFIGGLFVLAGVAAFGLAFLALWKPQLLRSKGRLAAWGKGLVASFVLLVIGGALVGPTENQPPADQAEPAAQILSSEPAAQPEEVVEQASDLSIDELEALLTESSAEVGALSAELLNNYYASRRSGNYAEFSLWRSHQWLPRVEALANRYHEIKEKHRRQINITHLSYILSGPTDLSLASLPLIWKEGDKNLDRDLAFAKGKLQDIRDRYELAKKEIDSLKQVTP